MPKASSASDRTREENESEVRMLSTKHSRVSEALTVCSLRSPSPPMPGSVAFTPENIVFRQRVYRPTSTKRAKAYSTTSAQCLHQVRKGKSFSMAISQQGDGIDDIQLEIPYTLVGNLPVLKDLWDATAPTLMESTEVDGTSSEAEDFVSHSPFHDYKQLSAEHRVPFSPPASLWALASVLLILEGKLNFWHWLGSSDGDSRFASDTLKVSLLLHWSASQCDV